MNETTTSKDHVAADPATEFKRTYRGAGTRHALMTQDLGDRRITTMVVDPDARGAAAMVTSPLGVLDEPAVRALRDDLTTWLDQKSEIDPDGAQ